MKTATKKTEIENVINQFITAANKFDIKIMLNLFASNAVIDDVSVGSKFKNTEGVRKYLENFFVGYHTVTKLKSIEVIDELHANAHVDFTGDFGHETGGLNATINKEGLILRIDAYLD